MELKIIEGLLEKYWEGETTRREEKILKDFFSQGAVPSHLKKAAALFQYYGNQQKIALKDADFDKNLAEHIDSYRFSSLSWMKIAASVLIICASIFLIYQMNERVGDDETLVENTVSYEDPEAAYEETKKALLMISAKLNTPEKYTDEIGKMNDASTLFK